MIETGDTGSLVEDIKATKEKSPKPKKMTNGESENHEAPTDNDTESASVKPSEPSRKTPERSSRKSSSKSPEPAKEKKEKTPLRERPRRSTTRSPQKVLIQPKEPTPQKTFSPEKEVRVAPSTLVSPAPEKSEEKTVTETESSREERQSFRNEYMRGRIRGRRAIRNYGISSVETRKRKSDDSVGPDSGKKALIDESTVTVSSPGWKYIPSPLQKFWSPQVAPTSSSTPLKLDQDANLSMEVNYDEATIQKQWQDSWQQDSVKQTPSKGYNLAKPNWKCVVM